MARWCRQVGEPVGRGQAIAEIETDKANLELLAEADGVLLELLVPAGATVRLGQPLALFRATAEPADAGAADLPASDAAPAPSDDPPAAPPAANPADIEPGRRASPSERRRALRGELPRAEAAAPPSPPELSPGDTLIPLSPMRRTIARRLGESKSSIPHFYLVREVRAEALWRFHRDLRAEAAGAEPAGMSPGRITLNDLVLKATARALGKVPEANASFSPQGMVRHRRVDLGIAVSVDEGLVTPVLRGADGLSLGALARAARDLIERARRRQLRGDEFSGSTFSVSNLGMLGVREFAAVINPPEAGILAVGALERRAVAAPEPGAGGRAGDDGPVVVERRLTLTLSADHRVLDGALAARLLAEIAAGLEGPLALML